VKQFGFDRVSPMQKSEFPFIGEVSHGSEEKQTASRSPKEVFRSGKTHPRRCVRRPGGIRGHFFRSVRIDGIVLSFSLPAWNRSVRGRLADRPSRVAPAKPVPSRRKPQRSDMTLGFVLVILGIMWLFHEWDPWFRWAHPFDFFHHVWSPLSLTMCAALFLIVIGAVSVSGRSPVRGRAAGRGDRKKASVEAGRKPLARSAAQKRIAGVCGGIGEYAGIDPWLSGWFHPPHHRNQTYSSDCSFTSCSRSRLPKAEEPLAGPDPRRF